MQSAKKKKDPEKKEQPAQDDKGLVGKWFHSMKGEEIHWQGQVVSKLSDRFYLVQLYEWFAGQESNMEIVEIACMVGWSFYWSDLQMKEYYSRHAARRGE